MTVYFLYLSCLSLPVMASDAEAAVKFQLASVPIVGQRSNSSSLIPASSCASYIMH